MSLWGAFVAERERRVARAAETAAQRPLLAPAADVWPDDPPETRREVRLARYLHHGVYVHVVGLLPEGTGIICGTGRSAYETWVGPPTEVTCRTCRGRLGLARV